MANKFDLILFGVLQRLDHACGTRCPLNYDSRRVQTAAKDTYSGTSTTICNIY